MNTTTRTALIGAAALTLLATACSSATSSPSTTATTPRVSTTATTPQVSTTTPTTAAPTTIAPTTSAPPTSSTSPPTEAPTTTTDPARVAALAAILDEHHVAGDFVGARIAVRQPDGSVSEAVGGTTSVDPASGPVDPDVAWNVGSVTKTFVAVVVLQLAEEGRIDLDAGIEQYLPNLPGADRITPRQLLQHTSGLNEYIDDPVVRADTKRVWTPDEQIAVAEAAGRLSEPGEAYHYANTNYIVLGEIVEDVTGRTWGDEVEARIAEPLGLTHTMAATAADLPIGYVSADGSFVDATSTSDPSIGGAAGALLSTTGDLLTFLTALNDGRLLSDSMRQQMQTFVPGDDYSQFGITHSYGLGIERYATDSVTVIGHMGTGESQSAFIGYDPATGNEVAVMTNTAIPGPQAFMALEALAA